MWRKFRFGFHLKMNLNFRNFYKKSLLIEVEEILMEKMRTYQCLYGKRRMHKEHDIKRSACAIF